MTAFDVQVLGGGIVGRSLALSLARIGLRVALRASPPREGRPADVRAYALNAASLELLRGLKVWDGLPAAAATPVVEMRVRGDAAGDGIGFSAWQQRVEALAWITDAAVLEERLAAAVGFAPHIAVIDADDTRAADAPLTAVCEGGDSPGRAALGVDFVREPYGHRAVAARLTSDRPHGGVAHQWFRAPDVLAVLPFGAPQPGRSFALVWSLPQKRADELLRQDDAAFAAEVTAASGGEAGALALASPRASWPLLRGRASVWSGPGWALLGDAAHVVHPLAGQGLNLGLADVAALTRVLAAREPWRSPGDEKLLRRYARERSTPTWAMGELTDGLLGLFSSELPALRELRNRGLTLVDHLSPIKRWLTSRALGSS